MSDTGGTSDTGGIYGMNDTGGGSEDIKSEEEEITVKEEPIDIETDENITIKQWFLTWVRSNPRGSVSQSQGFGGGHTHTSN